MRAFGDVLAQVMGEKGMTAKELSDASGVSQPHISQIVRGKVVDPSFLRAAAIIHALGMTLDEFARLQDAE